MPPRWIICYEQVFIAYHFKILTLQLSGHFEPNKIPLKSHVCFECSNITRKCLSACSSHNPWNNTIALHHHFFCVIKQYTPTIQLCWFRKDVAIIRYHLNLPYPSSCHWLVGTSHEVTQCHPLVDWYRTCLWTHISFGFVKWHIQKRCQAPNKQSKYVKWVQEENTS